MNGGQPEVIVLADAAAVAEHAAGVVDAAIEAALAATGRADIALAGGTTPGLLYDELTKTRATWSGVHLWIGDERCVPYDHPDSNVRMARERLPAPGAVLHMPPPDGDAAKRALAYSFQLKTRALDLVILGLGEDAHTASLFPDDPALQDDARIVSTTTAPKPPPERVSLGLTAIAEAAARLMLVTGAGKREPLGWALGEPDPHYPSSLLPADGTTVLADQAAAG
ncbi:MAG: 6-phosphogluconolactonase [Solirubrobacteraceae bacterium]|nr:6-phosphogluconolactonase [Solirubrobacteraceae bacterium]